MSRTRILMVVMLVSGLSSASDDKKFFESANPEAKLEGCTHSAAVFVRSDYNVYLVEEVCKDKEKYWGVCAREADDSLPSTPKRCNERDAGRAWVRPAEFSTEKP